MTGNYNLYFSITKEDFKNAIPDGLLGKYSKLSMDEDGMATMEIPESWEEAEEVGAFCWVRKSLNWNKPGVANSEKVAIIKDEFSILEGEVSALINMGEGKEYPFNSVLTKLEAQALVKTNLFSDAEGVSE